MTMFAKPDAFIVNKYDEVTTFLQKKGLVPLNDLIMGNTILFWGSVSAYHIIEHQIPYMAIILAPLDLFNHFNQWKESQGYWENARKMQKLNAEAVSHRDYYKVRYLIWVIALSIIPNFLLTGFFSVVSIIDIAGAISLVSAFYLPCCIYLGPGDYARNKKEVLSRQTQRE